METELKSVFIASIAPLSVAQRCGRLREDDQILMLGSECMVGVTNPEAKAIVLKAAVQGKFEVCVCRRKPEKPTVERPVSQASVTDEQSTAVVEKQLPECGRRAGSPKAAPDLDVVAEEEPKKASEIEENIKPSKPQEPKEDDRPPPKQPAPLKLATLADIAGQDVPAPSSPKLKDKPPDSPQPYHVYKSLAGNTPSKQNDVSLVPERDEDALPVNSAIKRKLFTAEKDDVDSVPQPAPTSSSPPASLPRETPTSISEENVKPTSPGTVVVAATPPMPHNPASGSLDSTGDTLSPLPSGVQFAMAKQEGSPKLKHTSPAAKNEKELTVEIDKAGGVLGILLAGGNDTPLQSILIKRLTANGAASQCGKLQAGDRLISVNGQSLEDVSSQEAKDILKTTPDSVTLVVGRRGSATTASLKQRRGSSRTRRLKRTDSGGDLNVSIQGRLNDSQTTLATLDDEQQSMFGSQESLDRMSLGSTVSERRGGTMRRKMSVPGTSISLTMARRAGISMADIKALELVKGTSGLGFSIVGGVGSSHGSEMIVIKTVFAGGPAAKSKQVHEGDIVIEVNGKDFTNITRSEAVAVLKGIPQGPVRLLLCSAMKKS